MCVGAFLRLFESSPRHGPSCVGNPSLIFIISSPAHLGHFAQLWALPGFFYDFSFWDSSENGLAGDVSASSARLGTFFGSGAGPWALDMWIKLEATNLFQVSSSW